MTAQTTSYSPDFQRFLQLVDASLIQASQDARELAERTGTPLVIRDTRQNSHERHDEKHSERLADSPKRVKNFFHAIGNASDEP